MANQLAWVVGAGLPDLLRQDFESGVIPPGWVNVSGSPNYGFTPPIPGYGTFSLGLTLTGVPECNAAFTTASEVFVFMAFRLTTLNAAQVPLFRLYTSFQTAQQMSLRVNGPGVGSTLMVLDGDGMHSATSVTAITAATTWYIWVHYKAGTGSNAIITVGYSTSLVEPTSGNNFASVASADSTGLVGAIDFTGVVDTTLIDHLGIATFDMPTGW